MKIAIVGSRNFKCRETFKAIMLQWNNLELVYSDIEKKCLRPVSFISGGAIGVDTWAEEFAASHAYDIKVIKPEWEKYGKKAGFLRNALIIKEAQMIIAFWDGKSKGTKHSIDLAIKEGKPIDIYIRN